MTIDPDCPPPPYTPSDPLTPATTQSPGSPLRLSGGDGQIPAYSPRTTEGVVDEGLPTAHAASEAPGFSSASAYFEQRGLRINTPEDVALHQIFVSPADRAEDIARIPLCWRNRTRDLTQEDMNTFANFLLPPDANTRLPPKLRADLASGEKAPMSPTDIESDTERRARILLVVSEWNDAFFCPRGLLVEIVFVPHHPPYAARGLDPICQSCVATNNSASRYASQAPYQHTLPSIPYGILPPRPLMAHEPEAFPHGIPPHAPYGRMPFGFGHIRGCMEPLAGGRGQSLGRGRDDCFFGRGGFHSNIHHHRHLRHGRRSRSRSRSSSSSSSSSESDSGRQHSRRHARRDRGPGRGRGCAEARGRRHEPHHRRRGRSSSSSSDSESSIDCVSARDIRGLDLQAIISGIAAAKLGKEGEKFGLKMDQMAQRFGFKMENIGNKIDAKLAVQELKTGLKEMKRENPASWKKELKGFKKDLKQQMKEIKKKKKGAKREAKERRKERKRNERDQERCGERRARDREDAEGREWNGDRVARADAGGQVTGVAPTHDLDRVESGEAVKT